MTVVQEMAKGVDHNTGFPEPLSPDRNTTLPHPEADTNNAVIEGANLQRTHSRSRSFRRNHPHKHNKIIDESALYANIQYADGTKEKRSSSEIEQDMKNGNPDGKQEDTGPKGEHEVDLSEMGDGSDESGYRDGGRKKGVLRKLKHKV